MEKYRFDFKIIVIGSSSVGKTSFVNKWLKNQFNETYQATIVSEFGYKIYQHNNNMYRVQMWDIGGQDKSISMTKIFCRDSHGVVIVCDISEPESLESCLKWKNVVDENSNFLDGDKLPCLLICNKVDLINDNEQLNQINNKNKEFCEKNDFIKYFCTSAKTGENINESMEYLINNIINRLEELCKKEKKDVFKNQSMSRNSSCRLSKKSAKGEKKKKCCGGSEEEEVVITSGEERKTENEN